MSDEPRYVDADNEFEDEPAVRQIPKWRLPQTDMQRRLLQGLGLKYWPLWSKETRSRFILAEKSTSHVGAIVPEWPAEWFEECLEWLKAKRKGGRYVTLKGFTTLYFDADARRTFREKFIPDRKVPDDPRYR